MFWPPCTTKVSIGGVAPFVVLEFESFDDEKFSKLPLLDRFTLRSRMFGAPNFAAAAVEVSASRQRFLVDKSRHISSSLVELSLLPAKFSPLASVFIIIIIGGFICCSESFPSSLFCNSSCCAAAATQLECAGSGCTREEEDEGKDEEVQRPNFSCGSQKLCCF